MLNALSFCVGLALVFVVLGSGSTHAEDREGCTERALADPPRTVIDCNGLLIEAEAFSAAFSTLPQRDAAGTSLEITDRAVLIELEPGTEPFQILTPQAIASVRGTQFVVDAAANLTRVFVIDGHVAVTRRDGADEAQLYAGDGIELEENAPLAVKRWPDQKVARLLARFGR